MNVIRRNTDYALRLIVGLVENNPSKPVSARQLAENGHVPYELACKMLQKLSSAKLVKSRMGANGDFGLAKKAEKLLKAPHILDTLAESYFVNGKYEEAIAAERRALKLVKSNRSHYEKQLEKFEKAEGKDS